MGKKKQVPKKETIVFKNEIFANKHFHKAIEEIGNSKLKAVDSFRINKLIKEIRSKNDDYEKVRKQKLSEYGEEDKKKGMYDFPDKEKREEFAKEMDDLGAIFVPIDLEKVKLPPSIELTVFQVGAIEDLFEFE